MDDEPRSLLSNMPSRHWTFLFTFWPHGNNVIIRRVVKWLDNLRVRSKEKAGKITLLFLFSFRMVKFRNPFKKTTFHLFAINQNCLTIGRNWKKLFCLFHLCSFQQKNNTKYARKPPESHQVIFRTLVLRCALQNWEDPNLNPLSFSEVIGGDFCHGYMQHENF